MNIAWTQSHRLYVYGKSKLLKILYVQSIFIHLSLSRVCGFELTQAPSFPFCVAVLNVAHLNTNGVVAQMVLLHINVYIYIIRHHNEKR